MADDDEDWRTLLDQYLPPADPRRDLEEDALPDDAPWRSALRSAAHRARSHPDGTRDNGTGNADAPAHGALAPRKRTPGSVPNRAGRSGENSSPAAASGSGAPQSAGAPHARPGDRVAIPSLAGLRGTVVKVDGDQAVVETEAARVRVNAGELIVLADGAASPSGGSRATLVLHSAPDLDGRVMRLHGRDGRHHRRWRALDLHGLVLTDALERLDDFLFAAWDDNQQTVAIVHGKGAGTLRDAVRAQLAAHPAVHHFKGALPNHGGDGVTIVALYHRHDAR